MARSCLESPDPALKRWQRIVSPRGANLIIFCTSKPAILSVVLSDSWLCRERQIQVFEEEIPHESRILMSSMEIEESRYRLAGADLEAGHICRAISPFGGARMTWMLPRVIIAVAVLMIPVGARSQSLVNSEDAPGGEASGTTAKLELSYTRPTQRTRVVNYLFDAYGPYPLVGAGVAAGINQLSNSAPEWGQGAQGYGKRLGSDFAIAAVGTTTRYGLSQALNEDAMYYRCDCRGFLPRVSHAVVSTWTERRGMDGHRIFSFPALVAPYAGTFTAVYGWYPDRFGAKDAFRMGNYTFLGYVAGNLSLEFFYRGPRSLLSRMHLNDAHGAHVQGPNP